MCLNPALGPGSRGIEELRVVARRASFREKDTARGKSYSRGLRPNEPVARTLARDERAPGPQSCREAIARASSSLVMRERPRMPSAAARS